LIITECSQISKDSRAFPASPGIHSQEQIDGWKKVVEAVYSKNSKIFLQIWHGGRASPKEFSGVEPVAPSPIAIRETYISGTKSVPYDLPKEMSLTEIQMMIKTFGKAATNAKSAGFDGIEVQGANGYLVDQFIRSSTNKRKDIYGGSIENRCRFCVEVIEELITVFPSQRIGIKLSPVGRFNDISDENPIATYSFLLKELKKREIGFVELVDTFDADNCNDHPLPSKQIENVIKTFRPFFKGTIIANSGFNFEKANGIILEKDAELVSFGQLFIGNPDLVERLKNGWPLSDSDPNLWMSNSGSKGYTDYPFYNNE
jgi:2,4-dienoyl-CoA reductase-like NADH-dependent reductase (Old Yellow Enzyme family)